MPRLERERKQAPAGECFYCGEDNLPDDTTICGVCCLSFKRRRREYLARQAEAQAA